MAVLVGKPAPDFTATTVFGNNEIKEMKFSEYTKGKYAVVFFYPLDFTFVCPSELIAFDHRLAEFMLDRDFRDLAGDFESRLAASFARTVERSAALVAQWMALGFVHGVIIMLVMVLLVQIIPIS